MSLTFGPDSLQLGSDGTVLRGANGKAQYVPLVSCATKAVRDRFSEAVVTAVRQQHPGALD